MNTTYTNLTVTNKTKKDVPVYVTFGAKSPKDGCTPDPLTPGYFDFLTVINKLAGSFTLKAGDSQVFDTKGNCFTGNICFYIEPGCPVPHADFHHGKDGTSIAEFTLNPNAGCDEAIDISCVNGVNSYMVMETGKDQGWTYGPKSTPINSFYNRAMGLNSGNPGVYPVNCTVCTGLEGAKPCPTLPVGPAQKEPICNVQRTGRGGIVEVILTTPEPA